MLKNLRNIKKLMMNSKINLKNIKKIQRTIQIKLIMQFKTFDVTDKIINQYLFIKFTN